MNTTDKTRYKHVALISLNVQTYKCFLQFSWTDPWPQVSSRSLQPFTVSQLETFNTGSGQTGHMTPPCLSLLRFVGSAGREQRQQRTNSLVFYATNHMTQWTNAFGWTWRFFLVIKQMFACVTGTSSLSTAPQQPPAASRRSDCLLAAPHVVLLCSRHLS